MRVPRLMLTAVLGAIGVLGGSMLTAGAAVAAPPPASLIVNPSEGRADTQISVTYEVPVRASSASCPSAVEFTWDGRRWRVVTRSDKLTATCVFAFRAAPLDRTPGQHEIGANGLSSTFTILDRTASPTPSRPGTSRTTGGLTPTYDSTGQPGAGLDTSQGAVAPLDAGGSVLGEAAQNSGSGGGATSLILIFGGLLVLGGIAIFGLVLYWSRRGGGDGGVDNGDVDNGDVDNGVADNGGGGAADSDTQVFTT